MKTFRKHLSQLVNINFELIGKKYWKVNYAPPSVAAAVAAPKTPASAAANNKGYAMPHAMLVGYVDDNKNEELQITPPHDGENELDYLKKKVFSTKKEALKMEKDLQKAESDRSLLSQAQLNNSKANLKNAEANSKNAEANMKHASAREKEAEAKQMLTQLIIDQDKDHKAKLANHKAELAKQEAKHEANLAKYKAEKASGLTEPVQKIAPASMTPGKARASTKNMTPGKAKAAAEPAVLHDFKMNDQFRVKKSNKKNGGAKGKFTIPPIPTAAMLHVKLDNGHKGQMKYSSLDKIE